MIFEFYKLYKQGGNSMNFEKISLFLFFFCFSVTLAQSQTTDTTEKVDEKTADIAITANVTAKELKFEVVPTPKVEFPGTPERKTEWSSERKNLPDSVEPNVIYRDIGIKLKIVSVFADIDKIVDEALGIKPATENVRKAETPTQTEDDKSREAATPPTANEKPKTTDKPKN